MTMTKAELKRLIQEIEKETPGAVARAKKRLQPTERKKPGHPPHPHKGCPQFWGRIEAEKRIHGVSTRKACMRVYDDGYGVKVRRGATRFRAVSFETLRRRYTATGKELRANADRMREGLFYADLWEEWLTGEADTVSATLKRPEVGRNLTVVYTRSTMEKKT